MKTSSELSHEQSIQNIAVFICTSHVLFYTVNLHFKFMSLIFVIGWIILTHNLQYNATSHISYLKFFEVHDKLGLVTYVQV